ncbi:hypothetical protein BDZ45DRAFT_798706 [Acephala macrosclerotiorum]|nr:hypothetical protein BDZ45DRAFT_798706 [Acephala macrosclerotiorum]
MSLGANCLVVAFERPGFDELKSLTKLVSCPTRFQLFKSNSVRVIKVQFTIAHRRSTAFDTRLISAVLLTTTPAQHASPRQAKSLQVIYHWVLFSSQRDFEYESFLCEPLCQFFARTVHQLLCNVATRTTSKHNNATLAAKMTTLSIFKKRVDSKAQPKSSVNIPYIPPEIMRHILTILLEEKDYCTATCLGLINTTVYALLRDILTRASTRLCLLYNNLPKPKPCLISLVHRADRHLSIEEIATIPRAVDWQGPPLWYLLREFMGPDLEYCNKSVVFRKKKQSQIKVLRKLGHWLGKKQKDAPSCHYMVNAEVLVHRYKGTNVYCRSRWGFRDIWYVPVFPIEPN